MVLRLKTKLLVVVVFFVTPLVFGFRVLLKVLTLVLVSAAELLAISTALDIAWDHGFRRLILETDLLSNADAVNNKDGACARRRPPYEKELVESIRNKKKNRKWDVQIVHSKREGNKVADWLAYLSHGLLVGDQIEFQKLPHGCRSCHELMLEDTRLAKTKAGRSDTDRLTYIGIKGTA